MSGHIEPAVGDVELSESTDRELGKLDAQHRKRILKFLHERVAKLDDPRSLGEALHGSRLGEFWKYRVGDYRLLCKIEDDRLARASDILSKVQRARQALDKVQSK